LYQTSCSSDGVKTYTADTSKGENGVDYYNIVLLMSP